MDLKTLKAKLLAPKNSPAANEWEQGVLRIFIILFFLLYFVLLNLVKETSIETKEITLVLACYFVISVFSFLWVYKFQGLYPLRIYLNMLGDSIVVTIGLILGGIAGAPGLVVYLWITLGNGFRYGLNYLIVCAFFSVVGLSLAAFLSEFWIQNPYWLFTSFALIIIVPAYSAKLLKNLHQAIEQANQANKAKTEFLSNMSHELRTPLNGVIGASDVLLRSSLSEQQKELTETIHFSANALLDQIQDILDFSKIEARQYALTNEKFDLSELLAGIYSMFYFEIKNKDLTFSIVVNPNTQNYFYGDASVIRKTLINFLGNAIKFTHQGGITVNVRGDNDDGQYKLRFSVVDTGIGIAKEKQVTIFSRFTQADESTTRAYGGTGLGTTIAKELVALSGGEIYLESELGVGSTFGFYLPVEVEQSYSAVSKIIASNKRIACFTSKSLEDQLDPILNEWGFQSQFFDFESNAMSTYIKMGHHYDGCIVEAVNTKDATAKLNAIANYFDQPDQLTMVYLPKNIYQLEVANGVVAKDLPIDIDNLFSTLFQHWAVHKNKVTETKESNTYKPLNIFMAEDNAINQKVALQILHSVKHQVTVCSDGEAALDDLEQNEYDLLILDINMPNISGIEVLKAYRFMGYKNTPVIMLSADATPQTRQACLDAGANAFITKPFQAQSLLEKIQSLYNGDEVIDEPATVADYADNRLVDKAKINDLCEIGGTAFLKGLLLDYEKNAKGLLDDIRQSCFAKNYQKYRHALHALKGSSADIGLLSLIQQCELLEQVKVFQLSENNTMNEVDKLANQINRSVGEYNDQIIVLNN